jgi:hypothetical protein
VDAAALFVSVPPTRGGLMGGTRVAVSGFSRTRAVRIKTAEAGHAALNKHAPTIAIPNGFRTTLIPGGERDEAHPGDGRSGWGMLSGPAQGAACLTNRNTSAECGSSNCPAAPAPVRDYARQSVQDRVPSVGTRRSDLSVCESRTGPASHTLGHTTVTSSPIVLGRDSLEPRSSVDAGSTLPFIPCTLREGGPCRISAPAVHTRR